MNISPNEQKPTQSNPDYAETSLVFYHTYHKFVNRRSNHSLSAETAGLVYQASLDHCLAVFELINSSLVQRAFKKLTRPMPDLSESLFVESPPIE